MAEEMRQKIHGLNAWGFQTASTVNPKQILGKKPTAANASQSYLHI
jgi:hypothetical protein